MGVGAGGPGHHPLPENYKAIKPALNARQSSGRINVIWTLSKNVVRVPHNSKAAFHQGLLCLYKQNRSSEKFGGNFCGKLNL